MGILDLKLPVNAYDKLAQLHRVAKVMSEDYMEDGIYVKASVPSTKRHEFDEFINT